MAGNEGATGITLRISRAGRGVANAIDTVEAIVLADTTNLFATLRLSPGTVTTNNFTDGFRVDIEIRIAKVLDTRSILEHLPRARGVLPDISKRIEVLVQYEVRGIARGGFSILAGQAGTDAAVSWARAPVRASLSFIASVAFLLDIRSDAGVVCRAVDAKYFCAGSSRALVTLQARILARKLVGGARNFFTELTRLASGHAFVIRTTLLTRAAIAVFSAAYFGAGLQFRAHAFGLRRGRQDATVHACFDHLTVRVGSFLITSHLTKLPAFSARRRAVIPIPFLGPVAGLTLVVTQLSTILLALAAHALIIRPVHSCSRVLFADVRGALAEQTTGLAAHALVLAHACGDIAGLTGAATLSITRAIHYRTRLQLWLTGPSSGRVVRGRFTGHFSLFSGCRVTGT